MLHKISSRLTYANTMSTLAVFMALGGISYAAVKLPANSVGTKQIKRNAVTGSKVKSSSLTGSDVRDGSLTAKDFGGSVQGAQGPTGAQGPAGPAGTPGPRGDTGPSGATNVVVRRNDAGPLPGGAFASNVALCEPGERATGGGGGFEGNGGNEVVQQSYPVDAAGQRAEDGATAVGWRAFLRNANAAPLNYIIYVVCARP